MEVIRSPPDTSNYVPLAVHQSATPASFYNGPPVLHYHSKRSKIVILTSDLELSAPIASLANAFSSASKQSATTNGHGAEAETESTSEAVINDAEVWVTSEKFVIFSKTASAGLAIQYPAISLHAIQSLPEDEGLQGLYLQLISSTGGNTEGTEDDEDMESVSLTVIPSLSAPATQVPAEDDEATSSPANEATLLFHALSACSNLHPDPVSEGDELEGIEGSSLFQAGLISVGDSSGGLPPPIPGSGGWITAENMGEYFDAEGNFIGGSRAQDEDVEVDETQEDVDAAPLGAGAGTVRARDDEAGERGAANGQEAVETKWRRTR